MVFCERDVEIAIGGGDVGRVALGDSGPTVGDADVIENVIEISDAGMTLRISFSIAAKRASVSSRRVPAGARTCRRIWPASTFGKKSSPTRKMRPSEASENA